MILGIVIGLVGVPGALCPIKNSFCCCFLCCDIGDSDRGGGEIPAAHCAIHQGLIDLPVLPFIATFIHYIISTAL